MKTARLPKRRKPGSPAEALSQLKRLTPQFDLHEAIKKATEASPRYPDWLKEHFEVLDPPSDIDGYIPVELGIVGPKGAKLRIIKVEKFGEETPFRRFKKKRVFYEILNDGQREEKTAAFFRPACVNVETLQDLEQYLKSRSKTEGKRGDFDINGDYPLERETQESEAFEEAQELIALLHRLDGLKNCGEAGELIRNAILWYSNLAFHAGLKFREAELAASHQAIAVAGKKSREGAGRGGSLRGKVLKGHAEEWHGTLQGWLSAAITNNRFEQWLNKPRPAKPRRSVSALAQFCVDNWPVEGFKGKIDTQKVPLGVDQLRKIISGFQGALPSWR